MKEHTHESEARRRWRLIKTVFFGDAEFQPTAVHIKKPERSRAKARWSFVRRTFEIEVSNEMQKPSEQDFPSVDLDLFGTLDGPLEVKTIAADDESDNLKTEPSLTAIDSPYRSALLTLASLDLKFYEADGRKMPSIPTMPQVSMVRYHPNHEAFFDEDSGFPVPKVSTRSFKNPTASAFGGSGLADVREDAPKKPSVHDFYSRKKRASSFRLRNLRFTITQTLSRYLRACTHPDVKV